MYTTFRKPLTRRHRLICFPYAGGSANDYRDWVDRIPGTDIVAARLPGRDSRYTEPAETRFVPLLDDLVRTIEPYLGADVTLFGHSMGGLLAFEIARRLEADGRAPTSVVASGCLAPRTFASAGRTDFSDETLLAELRAEGPGSAEVRANDELLNLMLPIFRADLQLIADYRLSPAAAPLARPVRLYYGADDVPEPGRLRQEWAEVVSGGLELRRFPGDHFFVRSAREDVLCTLAEDVTGRVRTP
jgi:medium-chain acyl-[acyl-carrier-protein] hydrolase